MEHRFSRTEALLGEEALARLSRARVAVFGVGGVGGYVVEALARSGIGALDVIDGDTVSLTNINRQILATTDTVGRLKTAVAAERIRAIHPDCRVQELPIVFSEERVSDIDVSAYDYVVDAIDDVPAKLLILRLCKERGVPVISAMGAGNKLDPTAFEVADISKTSVCPLARKMRTELRRLGITGVKVVYSKEPPVTQGLTDAHGRRVPASCIFAPAGAGLLLAAEVVRDLLGATGADLIVSHDRKEIKTIRKKGDTA